MKRYWIPISLVLILAGCTAPSESPKTDGSAKTAEGSKPESEAAKTGQTAVAAEGEPAKPAPTVADLAADLKHDAFEYYGLGYDKPIDMEVVSTSVVTGAQITKLKEIVDGKAVYTVERTGGLAALGSNELTLEKDGIYLKSSSIAKVGTHDLEMPAKLSTGSTWTTTTELDQNGQTMKISSTYKVVGPVSIKTKVATYPDALLVTSSGKGNQNGNSVQIDTRSWFVKGRGNVKAEIKRIPAKGKPETIVLQETK